MKAKRRNRIETGSFAGKKKHDVRKEKKEKERVFCVAVLC